MPVSLCLPKAPSKESVNHCRNSISDDDDRTDVMMFKRALEDLKITNPFIHSTDCKEALDYLTNQDNKKPWIVITDLNTPQMSGLEFLTTVKAHNALKNIIVIILSGSGDERDVD